MARLELQTLYSVLTEVSNNNYMFWFRSLFNIFRVSVKTGTLCALPFEK